MKAETYSVLLKDLQKLQKAVVASQIATARRDPLLAAKLERLHSEAEVGGRLDDFVGTAARKSTVLLLLRTVFVRVLEDLGILRVKRIRDEWGFAAFREVAPALGVRAYFAFVFRDLAVDFPALFAPSEDELPLPDEDNCRALWALWHHPNRDGDFYVWNGDGFDSRFLGDLYQDLDADIRKRYALLQTPRFVEEYILDHTLTPALAEFDPEKLRLAGERFRLLDPTCGSGHFLIGAFQRLADYWRDKHRLTEWAACERALEGVWGCDINPHAVEIADFRLLLEVVARTGVKDLQRIAALKLNLHAMDSLIPWERAAKQGELFPAQDRLDAYATLSQRRQNAAFLARAFHVVVGNPPYIQPADGTKAEDYRAFWPDSCFKEFCLHAPFIERFLVLGAKEAFTGQIVANNFTKRAFGKAVITKVLSRWRTTGVIDSSLAPIPGHGWKGGTSTVMFFGRCMPFEAGMIPWVLAKRRDSAKFDDPSRSQAWLDIENADLTVDRQGPFVDIQLRSAAAVSTWPWDLRGQDGQEIVQFMEQSTDVTLQGLCAGRIGSDVITRAPDIFEWSLRDARRLGVPTPMLRRYADGKDIRDWHASFPDFLLLPYVGRELMSGADGATIRRLLWPWRVRLAARFVSGGVTLTDKGLPFFAVPQVPWHKHETHKVIAFPFVTTEPHFALVDGDAWFKDSVKLIKLPAGGDWLRVVGVLNTSSASFWLRGKFKGAGRVKELWEDWIQIDEKLGQFPIPKSWGEAHATLTSALLEVSAARAASLPIRVLSETSWSPVSLPTALANAWGQYALLTNRMVALQDELDWLTYSLYGLLDPPPAIEIDDIEPVAPGNRPFEIVLARLDNDAGENEKSAWWSRHNHDKVIEIPSSCSNAQRTRLQQRVSAIESDERLAMLETPAYKRRWEPFDWRAETANAAESWLLDHLEDLFAPATATAPRGPLAEPKPYRLEEIAAACSHDPRVAAVAGVWTGTGLSVDLSLVAEKLLRANALPDNPHRLYSDEGRRKLDEWKRVWGLQDQEDAWEKAAAEAKVRNEAAPKKRLVDPNDPTKQMDAIPLPPKFEKQDFARPEFFSVRGKLNVPRERFILFGDLSPNRFGWNGWRGRERALAQVEAFTLAESDPQQPLPVPTSDEPRRCGVTYGLWESLADVKRWGTEEEHSELHALAREACRQPRCPCPIVDAWKATVLDVKAVRAATAKAKAAKKRAIEVEDQQPAKSEPTVSLAARAWVASLFQPGKELDAAGVWSSHCARLAEPPQRTLPGIKAGPVQLSMPVLLAGPPSELVGLDPIHLALVLDDLVASGDLQASGRGNKKRFQLVRRGVSS